MNGEEFKIDELTEEKLINSEICMPYKKYLFYNQWKTFYKINYK